MTDTHHHHHHHTHHTHGVVSVRPSTGDEAWFRLKEGNARFVAGDMTAYLPWIQTNATPAVRTELAGGQKPYATVLTCSDSRLSPELLFDTGLGEVFVVRVAGNVADPVNTGSIEYACHHLNTPLLLVLGHTKCGAVTAAVQTPPAAPGEHLPSGGQHGYIPAILDYIHPAVATAKERSGGDEATWVSESIIDNVKVAKKTLLSQSSILEHLVHEGKLKVVGAVYHLDSGVVEEVHD